MSLIKRIDLMAEGGGDRGRELSGALYNQFNQLHSMDFFDNKEIELMLLKQRENEVGLIGIKQDRPSPYIFSPSGASKCERELFYKFMGESKREEKYPYQRRWTRNASAVHEAVQRDLLYSEKLLKEPSFVVKRMDNGLPAWESNLKTYKEFIHNGVSFLILGMMDGILTYKDGSDIGFEFKTKSNSIGQVGNYKMKDIADPHKEQCIAYSLLFGLNEFLLMYESVAKDGWTKNAEAKVDVRTFYYKVTDEDKTMLLNKFASVVQAAKDQELPIGRTEKCLFCPYKHICPDGTIKEENK